MQATRGAGWLCQTKTQSRSEARTPAPAGGRAPGGGHLVHPATGLVSRALSRSASACWCCTACCAWRSATIRLALSASAAWRASRAFLSSSAARSRSYAGRRGFAAICLYVDELKSHGEVSQHHHGEPSRKTPKVRGSDRLPLFRAPFGRAHSRRLSEGGGVAPATPQSSSSSASPASASSSMSAGSGSRPRSLLTRHHQPTMVLTARKVGARNPRHARPLKRAVRGSGLLRSSHPLRCAPWCVGGVGTRNVI